MLAFVCINDLIEQEPVGAGLASCKRACVYREGSWDRDLCVQDVIK